MDIRRANEQQTLKRTSRGWRLGMAGLLTALFLCLSSTAWAANMVTNGAFNLSTSWTLGGTGMSYSTAQNHVGTAGTGSLLETISGKNKSATGTAVQSVTITAGSVITAKTDIVAWAMESWTGAAGATRTITIDLRYSDATTVNIFTGTVAANSAWTSITNTTATVFPLTLTKNVNQITVSVTTSTGNNATAVSSLYTDDISITYTPAVIDSLTVTSNTPVATTAIPGTVNIQMQYLQLNSDAAGNGNCVLTSATVDDVNIAATGTIANLKVHIDSDTNFTNGVLGTATVAAWNGQSVVVDLTAIAAASRTVTSGTPKYLWITYDIDPLAVNGTTVQSRVTAIGVAAPDTPPIINLGTADSNSVLITTGLGCGGCHPLPVLDGVARNGTNGAVVGNHTTHGTTYAYYCNTCHIEGSQGSPTDTPPGTYNSRHRRGTIEMNVSGIGSVTNARYDKNGDHVADTVWNQTSTPTLGKCENTACHGGTNAATFYGGPTGAGPTWGATHTSTCTFCHNRAKVDSGVNADAYPVQTTSPFRSNNAAGTHALHLTGTSSLMNGGVLCADCHTVPATVNAAGHIDTNIGAPADVPFPAGSDARLNSYAAAYNSGGLTCNVYCHGAAMPKGDTSGTNEANTLWTANWANYPAGCTPACHGLPPTAGTSAGTHSGQAFPGSCNTCHPNTVLNTANPPSMSTTYHINGTVEASGCTGCHGTDPKQYPPVSFWGTNKSTADGVGAHVTHLEATAAYMTKEAIGGEADTTGYWCAECHTTTRGAGGHNDGYPGEVAFTNAVESKYNAYAASRTVEGDANPDLGNGTTCSVYCHGVSMPKGDTSGTTKTPAWGVTLTGCNPCHGAPPTAGTSAGAHSGQAFPTSCITCHPSTVLDTNNPPTLAAAFHINGTVEASGCNGCHGGDNNTNGWNNKNMWPYAGGAYPKRLGEHEAHINALIAKLGTTVAAVIADDALQKSLCDYCHNDAAGAGGTNHNDSGTPTAPANVGSFNRIWDATADAGGTAATYVTATNTCSNVDCHNEKSTTTNNNDWFDASTSSCIMCHTVGGTNSATIAHPSSGIHDVARITGRLHDDSFAYGTNGASTANCITCHTATPTSNNGHINGTNNYSIGAVGGATRVTLAAAVGFTDAVVPTCSPTQANGCHIEQWNAVTDHTWVHQWHESAGNNNGTECRGCHGTFTQTWQSGVSPVHTTNFDGDGSAEIRLNHDHGAATETEYNQCISCHVYNDATYGTLGWNPTAASKHGNGQIEMITAMGYATASNTCANTCHNVPEVGSHAVTPDSGWTVVNLAGPSLTCTACHTGSGSGGLKVSNSSPHTTLTKGGANGSAACSVCHPEHTGGVLVANNATVGINYTAGARTGFRLGGTGTTGATEPEICWNCHDITANGSLADAGDVSEWGTNTGGTYNYGSFNKKSWFDAAGTWTSANFTYKNGILSAKPSARHARWSSHDVASTVGTTREAIGYVVCSYCHDVHNLNLAAGDTQTGKPFLRGTWRPSGYKEDGAPKAGVTFAQSDAVYGAVPRGSLTTTGNGGYQIDQNNGNPNATYTYATNDGLCNLCHTQASIQTAWIGHNNSVMNFANDTNAARNIFGASKRGLPTGSGNARVTRPYMGYQGVTDYQDTGKSWMGGFRSQDLATAPDISMDAPRMGGSSARYGYTAAEFKWGAAAVLNITGTTVNADYHSFSCSKCHTPHASRLPRLMITNCLDTRLNTWDDQFASDTNWTTWAALDTTGQKQLAYTTSAQNCHRRIDFNGDGDTADAGEEPGWNTATPW